MRSCACAAVHVQLCSCASSVHAYSIMSGVSELGLGRGGLARWAVEGEALDAEVEGGAELFAEDQVEGVVADGTWLPFA